MKELIDGYHQKQILPVLNIDAHEPFLKDFIPGYAEEGFPALERFAEESGFGLIQRDYGFRFVFYPNRGRDDTREWPQEDVPVDESNP